MSENTNRGAAAPLPAVFQPTAVYNDPLLAGYWHLGTASGATKGINALNVWDAYRGGGVIVGVIDDGVEYTHPDLAPRYATALDFDGRDGDLDAYPSASSDAHGTAVAGVIAATLNNGVGAAGVAPESTLTAYRVGFGSNVTLAQFNAVFERLDSLHVANNSWGIEGFLTDNFGSLSFAPMSSHLKDALDNGRAGLGTVVVFSAGNAASQGQNVNYHNLQNHRGVISVAATDSAGNVASFSTPGAAVLVAAPGVGIQTTDRVGAFGYTSGDSVSVSGTSFSAPLVSGVAALMLDANASLGWRDTQEILAATAVQSGTNTQWSFNRATNWNGGGMHVSNDLGFGLVDATAAVRVAESWRKVSTSSNEAVMSAAAAPNAVIPDLGTVQSVLALGGGLRIDRVEVDLSVAHTNIGDLKVVLTSPTGTQSVLFNNPPTTQDNISFTFSTTRDWGELSGGNWSLSVSDTVAGTAGTLKGWTIRVYGDAAADDVYIYTDEFSTFAPAAAGRRSLADSGGTDIINTAAIGSATFLDLRPGQTSTIDGQSVTVAAGTIIENADTGDGNDTLLGNDVANSLRGWRGNDALMGFGGADTLDGGAGVDTASYAGSAAGVNVNLGTGVASGGDAAGDILVSIENLTGSNHNDTLEGDAANNVLNGGAGSDVLRGYAGVDTMIGGAGDDFYSVHETADVIVEEVNSGTEYVWATATYTLGANVEHLFLWDSASIDGTGNTLANNIYGNAGNNVLAGLGGADRLDGGAGVDTASYAASAAGVNVNLGTGVATGGDAAGDILVSIENVTGSSYNDTLEGDAANNVLNGGAGSDVLRGYGGVDTLIGGGSDDYYSVHETADVIVENASEGNDSVWATASYTLSANVENLFLWDTVSIDGTGNALANVLEGNSGNNKLNGGAGNDVLRGNAGVDTLDGGAGADSLSGGAGNDVFVFRPGEASGDSILDFVGNGAAAGDMLQFIGFGLGASLIAAGAGNWLISYNAGTEMILLAGLSSIDASDYLFA